MSTSPFHRMALRRPAPLAWLFDRADPADRLHALQEIAGAGPEDPRVLEARTRLVETSAVAAHFAAQRPDGSWGDLGGTDDDHGTASRLSQLLLLGVSPREPRVVAGVESLLKHRRIASSPAPDMPGDAWSFSSDPADVASCVTGDDLSIAIRVLGPTEENHQSVLWLLRHQRHDGGWLHCHRWHWKAKAKSLLRSGKLAWPEETDPAVRSCRFGTFRAMNALATLEHDLRDDHVRRALTRGAEHFLERGITGSLDSPVEDLALSQPSFNAGLQILGTPVRQTTDMLAIARLLVDLGYGPDVRLSRTLRRIRDLQDDSGRWHADAVGPGTLGRGQKPGAPSKRVTTDAIGLLLRVARSEGEAFDLGGEIPE